MGYSRGPKLVNFKLNSRRFENNAFWEGGCIMKLVTSRYISVGKLNMKKAMYKDCGYNSLG